MLTYHQGFDIYHTVYRILNILELGDFDPQPMEKIRILDFLILFPEDFRNIKVPMGATAIKKITPNKYNLLPNRKRIFYQMGKYFYLSTQCMLSYGLLDIDQYKEGFLMTNDIDLIRAILSGTPKSINLEVLNILKDYFIKMDLTELKQRTQLIEYRYDISKN